MNTEAGGDFVLGIDLGSNSLGWALIKLVDDNPVGILRAGVRVFQAGMEGDLESGREESRNKTRRDARLHRRQLWRRARRLTKTYNALQRFGLLPSDDASSPDKRQDAINRLDDAIRSCNWFKEKTASGRYPEPDQTLPYVLRATALDEPLEPHILGRALYHLAQRRGYWSNRKQVTRKGNDDEGAVKEGIAELRKAMQEKSARTLGEYFSRLAPSEERIRSRWTARDMYEAEFEAIWVAQSMHHAQLLTEERRKALRRIIFYQRPLWFDPGTIGQCELEPGERRAPAHLLVSQRFRLLQTVNNLAILPPGDVEMPLTPADRKKLIDELERKGDLKFKRIRNLLGLTDEYQFNLERGGEKSIKGNRTNADFQEVFGERWPVMPPEGQDSVVEYVHSFQRADKLKEAAKKHFGLDDQAAEKLSQISLEPDYMNLSRKAMERLVPSLEEGTTYGEARKLIYPESFRASEPTPLLPALDQALKEVRNPAVTRCLAELRKVVNAVIRQYGKPAYTRIELARDLKKSKKRRAAISEANRRNEKARAEAAEKIIAAAGIRQPKPDDIRKYQLAEECLWQCPYTGKSVSMGALFGPEPQFDIEHIIPFSRSMDNSFQNLTLCHVPENRSAKGNKTPHEAYSGDPERYQAILGRVKQFAGERAVLAAKLKRFILNDQELEGFLEDFRNRQLNDTAYASTLASRYLGLLYGAVNDAEGKRRVQATSGQATHYFRSLWQLNSILNDGPTKDGGYKPKSRNDHRHHAIDAVVIGLTDAAMIKRLSDAARRAPIEHRRRFASLEGPWPNFVDALRADIDRIVVSHRVSKKVSGPLHEETIYSAPGADGSVRVRKPLAALTKNEVEEIADRGVKALVLAKLNDGDPKKVFANVENLPFFGTSDGRRIPIKSARIFKKLATLALGSGRSTRHVASESNHHVEIFAEVDNDGNEVVWDSRVVSLHEARTRMRLRQPIVQRDHGLNTRFKFSLAPGETIEWDDQNKGGRSLMVVRATTGGRVGLVPVRDARQKKEMTGDGSYTRPAVDTLRKLNARKVSVSPLGEVSEAHD